MISERRQNVTIAVCVSTAIGAAVAVIFGRLRPTTACAITGNIWAVMALVLDSSHLRRTQGQLVADHMAGWRRHPVANTLSTGGLILNLIWLFG